MTNPEFGSNPEQFEDKETTEISEAAAEKKAEQLAQIRDYAFRFMSVDEYEALLSEQRFPEQETLLFEGEKETALEFIRKGQKTKGKLPATIGWKEAAKNLTGHPVSTLNMEAYDILLHCLREARNEVDKDTKSREEILKKFRDKLTNFTHNYESKKQGQAGLDRQVNYSSSWGFGHGYDSLSILEYVKEGYLKDRAKIEEIIGEIDNTLPDSEIEKEIKDFILKAAETHDAQGNFRNYIDSIKQSGEIDTQAKEEVIKLLNEVTWVAHRLGLYGTDRLKTVHEFLTAGQLSELDVRKVIQAIGTVPSGAVEDSMGASRQYEVAMFFDPRGQTGWSDMVEFWTHLDNSQWEKRTKEPIANAFLAAVALLPDKELEQKMIEVAKKAKEASVPVFNRDGVMRYPAV